MERLAGINLATAVLILPACWVALWRGRYLSRSERRGGRLLVVLGLIQLANFLLFQKWAKPISTWYLAPLLVFTSGSMAAAVVNLIGGRRALRVCLVAAVCVLVFTGLRENRWRPVGRAPGAPERFVAACPRDAIWAATDCGRISFWTGARFVNLDGLINGFEYQRALRDHKLGDYLAEAGVRYLMVGLWERPAQPGNPEPMYAHRVDPAVFAGEYQTYKFYVYSYMYGAYSDSIELSREQEVWRSNPGLDGTVPARTLVFDLDL
jgi:hypothetical protein